MLSRYELTPWQTPFGQLQAMQRDMNALFSRVFGEGEQRGNGWWSSPEGYTPHIESCVKDNALHIKADLPGMEPNDVEITVEGNQLTLRGERKAEQEKTEGQYVHREVRYGSFERRFAIPEGVKAEEIQAHYRNGVLELTVPLPQAVLPKKVSIAVEGQADSQKQIGTAK